MRLLLRRWQPVPLPRKGVQIMWQYNHTSPNTGYLCHSRSHKYIKKVKDSKGKWRYIYELDPRYAKWKEEAQKLKTEKALKELKFREAQKLKNEKALKELKAHEEKYKKEQEKKQKVLDHYDKIISKEYPDKDGYNYFSLRAYNNYVKALYYYDNPSKSKLSKSQLKKNVNEAKKKLDVEYNEGIRLVKKDKKKGK